MDSQTADELLEEQQMVERGMPDERRDKWCLFDLLFWQPSLLAICWR